jgi:lysophospholipase L1-like esterase
MILDVTVNGDVLQHLTVSGYMTRVSFAPLPEGLKQVEIWLDQRFPFRLKEVLVEDTAQICQTLSTRKRWVHYGSSISQAKAGYSPTQIWAALVARGLGLHLTNLGFSGECKLDPMIGRLIRDRQADYITLKLGINVYNGDLTRRTFAPNVIGLIQLIREGHPETPLVVISPIYSEPREVTPGGSGLTLPEMRTIVGDIVGICQKYGDQNIHYVDGLQIFGSAEAALHMPDQLHPDADGQFVLAEHFIKAVFEKYPVG